MKKENTRVLIVSPHQDDETIGCGGLIQKVTQGGGDVHIAVLTSVEDGQKFDRSTGEYQMYSGSQRKQEFQNALQTLTKEPGHISWEYYFGGEYHHRLDKLCVSDIISRIEKTVSNFKPDVFLLPYESWDQDHRITNQACKSVMRPHFYSGAVLAYEVLGETNFVPNLFIRLHEEEAQCKIQAFGCYQTQNTQKLHSVSTMSINTNMQYRGKMVFTPYCESYMVLRIVDNLTLF